jgi:hypothetical protein
MSGDRPPAGELGFEAFGTSCGLAVVAGALSALAPAFAALTATLVALALAGWASIHRRASWPRQPLDAALATYVAPFAVLGVAGAVFVDPPAAFAPWRALLLALGLVPLWVVERWPGRPRRVPRRRA